MRRYNNETLLEMVELYAEEGGAISSEEMLSESFDAMLEELDAETLCKLENDVVMLSEEFNNYADSLCKDGEIHPEQYNRYCYVGIYG